MVQAIFWVFGVEFWILPRLFDESITFAQSFVPLYSYEKVTSDHFYDRVALVVAFISFTVWMANQPSEFDEFIMASRKFTDDLYSGNLLPDRSQQSRDNIDKVKIPDLDDLMKESEENPFPDEKTEEGEAAFTCALHIARSLPVACPFSSLSSPCRLSFNGVCPTLVSLPNRTIWHIFIRSG